MIRIAQTYRITSIADFIASRYGKSPLLAALVTLITVVGIVPYIALQLKAVVGRLPPADRRPRGARAARRRLVARRHALRRAGAGRASPSSSAPATSTAPSGTRAWSRRSPSSRSSSCVAFLAVGAFVTWGLFDGMADIWARAAGRPRAARAARASAARTAPRLRLRAVVRADPAVDALGAASCRGSSR